LPADNMRLATMGWVSGCAVIWSSLFAIGNLLYGRWLYAGLLSCVLVISGATLVHVVSRLWGSHDQE
jgi:hypothetical protein